MPAPVLKNMLIIMAGVFFILPYACIPAYCKTNKQAKTKHNKTKKVETLSHSPSYLLIYLLVWLTAEH